MTATGKPDSRVDVRVLVMASGLAALSWEVVWQIKSSLALGVSAWGTAITLAVTMGGMSLGALIMGHALRDRALPRPARLYAIMEWIVGLAGLCLAPAFHALENLDTAVYAKMPGDASLVHAIGIAAVLGVPTVCMGATLPVFGLVARQCRTSIAVLYGMNTLGAACGALVAAFVLIPAVGVTHTGWIIAGVNFLVGLWAWTLAPVEVLTPQPHDIIRELSPLGFAVSQMVVAVTGFATFALEIAWFRSLTAAFHSTTDAFAIMLACVLIALGAAAQAVPFLKRKDIVLGTLVCWAGVAILLATPLVERFDLVPMLNHSMVMSAIMMNVYRFVATLYVIGIPVFLLGLAVPWLLDATNSARQWGRLYALNTLAAVAGSLGAAWLLLPTIGFAKTAWLAGLLVAVAGILLAPKKALVPRLALIVIALLIAVRFESGVGTVRAQGLNFYADGKPGKLLEAYEGPEATVSVVGRINGARQLLIDGASASGQSSPNTIKYEHYMPWMGHLPMLLAPDPKNALVICFGTGQTANAVRNENPQSLDIVDINPRIFRLAHNFSTNENVLADPRVKAIVMDGRAYIRRTRKTYDVITLEPMPPTFAGVNALYSQEFYQWARAKLSADGMIAQWLPFHAVAPRYSASIARTFQSVFPNAILWMDPVWKTGILLGTKNDNGDLGKEWPGFARTHIKRDLTEDDVKKAVLLDRKQLKLYGVHGEIITDDNQLLAYGEAVYSAYPPEIKEGNLLFLKGFTK